jgi:hypothetical protein
MHSEVRKGKKQLTQTQYKKKFKKLDKVMAVLFVVTMSLDIWAINIYRKTVIPNQNLFLVCALGFIVCGLILIVIAKKLFPAFWSLFLSAAIGGGIFYFCLLYTNWKFASGDYNSETFNIIKTGNLAGSLRYKSCRKPYAIIEIFGLRKQLVFDCEYQNTIKDFKTVTVKYRKGLWGFPIVEEQYLN